MQRAVIYFFPRIKISKNQKMSGPGAGFEYPPVEVSWLKRDALLFAVSIGGSIDDLPFVFVSDHFKAYEIMRLQK